MAEDDTIVPPQDALLALPIVMHLVLGPGGPDNTTSSSSSSSSSSTRGHLLYPWISLILSQDDEETCVMALVDHNVHHFLINQLMQATAVEVDRPTHIKGALLLLHDMLARGSNVACDEHQAFLPHHPQVLALLPRLASSHISQVDISSLSYIVWFIMSVMESCEEDEVESVLPPNGREHQKLLEGLAQVC